VFLQNASLGERVDTQNLQRVTSTTPLIKAKPLNKSQEMLLFLKTASIKVMRA